MAVCSGGKSLSNNLSPFDLGGDPTVTFFFFHRVFLRLGLVFPYNTGDKFLFSAPFCFLFATCSSQVRR